MQDADTVDAFGLCEVYVQKKSAAPKPERQMNNSKTVAKLERRRDCRQDSSFKH
jgi:hypothetical protein